MSKLRHFVSIEICVSLYYSLIYPFLTYGVNAWGNTYTSSLEPLFILQKKAIRLITFSDYNAHTNPLFQKLKVLKFFDVIFFNNALFVYNFYSNKLPESFDSFFTEVRAVHNYNTRFASKTTFYISKARTNFGKFKIKYIGAKVWNSIDESIKKLNLRQFKKELRNDLLNRYNDHP